MARLFLGVFRGVVKAMLLFVDRLECRLISEHPQWAQGEHFRYRAG